MQQSKAQQLSRREFVGTATAVAAAASLFPNIVTGAPPDKPLKVGLVGCGGRGKGAAKNAMQADPHVKVVALADIVQDRLDACVKELAEMTKIEPKNCFLGFDAYKKIADSDVDYVILATPPYYRPEHLAACVEAGKHVFMEKPVAVDPVGIRKILAAGKVADEKKRSIVAGTQRRHQNNYIATIAKIRAGAIGKIISGQCYWNMGNLWYHKREAGEDAMAYMHRDWVNWAWLSGDHIVEQHVHNLDIINWVLGRHPRKVVAMGARHQRMTGDQYDCFSADFSYPDADNPDDEKIDIHVHSMCRQIKGCANSVSERVIGQTGVSNCAGWISNYGDIPHEGNDSYVQEHADLIKAIRTGERINEAQNVAESTLCAIMARTSAYTGREVTWDEMMASDLVLGPPDYELTEENIRAHIPVPGVSPE